MTITVTQDHIDIGTPCKAARCPVALALRDVFLDVHTISVSNEEATLTGLDGVRTIALPDAVRDFISDFDVDRTGRPFQFDCEVRA